MSRSELLDKYRELVDRYDLLRQRIEKAEESRERFKSAVVDRVIADYQIQLRDLEEELAPSEQEMFEAVDELEVERAKLEFQKTELEENIDEIVLRHVLGEYTDEEAEERKTGIESELADVSARLEAVEAETAEFKEYLDRAGANERREVVQSVQEARPVARAPIPEPLEEVIPPMEQPPSVPLSPPVVAAAAVPVQSVPQPQVDSIPAAVPVGFSPSPTEDDGGGNAFEMILDDFPMSDEGGLDQELPSFPKSDDDELKGLTELDNSWQKDLSDDFPASSGFQDVLEPEGKDGDSDFPSLGFGEPLDELPPLGIDAAAGRTGYLTRHFGRPDEDRYEIRDDVTSIGRGRDNQIQIKDDTKVSRYHCRVLREPAGFFVEDNNSSNGTMVNGELITRRKVEGGEDVTIGETLFRFELR